MMKKRRIISIIFFSLYFVTYLGFPQESNKYILGTEERLQINVYVLGEVKDAGEYIVTDNTDLVEIISKAGGATEFSDLSGVTITRKFGAFQDSLRRVRSPQRVSKQIIKFDVNKYLKEPGSKPAPYLKPGDVIFIPKNKWRKWRNFATIIRDVSVVATSYFLYLRVR